MLSIRILLFLLAPCAALAQPQITVGSRKDNTLYIDAAGNLSNGAGTRMFCGNTGFITGGRTRRALVAFDLRAIPPGSIIHSATLTLNVAMGSITSQSVTLHAVLADWGEGTSFAFSGQGGGAPSTPGDATWIHTFFPNSMWQAAGGDFNATASGSTTVNTIGPLTWVSTPQMVADVQRWVNNPAQAFGWMVRTIEVGLSTSMAFDTKESITPANRPQLVISYTPAATVTSVGTGCTGGGATALALGAAGLPQVPNPAFAVTIGGGPAGPSVLLVTFDLSPVPIPIGNNCFVYVNPSTLVVTLPGGPTVPLPVPNVHPLIGNSLPLQAAAVDATTLQLATSNALTLNFGI